MVVKPTKITKYWPIHKILEEVPSSVEHMMEIGLNCFMCSANTEERLEEGMLTHGFTPDQVDELVDKINESWAQDRQKQIIKPTEKDFLVEQIREGNKIYYRLAGVLISEKAFDALHELQTNSGLQIKVEAGGCNGYSYLYDYKEAPEDDEQTYTLSGELDLFINDFTFDKLHGTTIDYESGLKGSGLIFHNPNVADACHCGASVGF